MECNVSVCLLDWSPEDGGGVSPQNVSIYRQVHTVFELRI